MMHKRTGRVRPVRDRLCRSAHTIGMAEIGWKAE